MGAATLHSRAASGVRMDRNGTHAHAWLPLLVVCLVTVACAAPNRTPVATMALPSAATPSAQAPDPADLDYRFELATATDGAVAQPYGIDAFPVAPVALPARTPLLVLARDAAGSGAMVLPADAGVFSLGLSWIGERRLAAATPNCPSADPTFADLIRLGRAAILCTADTDFSFVAYLPALCFSVDALSSGSPAWLNGVDQRTLLYAGPPPGGDPGADPPDGTLIVRARPPLVLGNCADARPDWSGGWFRFGAHLDDPAAATCSMRIAMPGTNQELTWPPELSRAACRLELVVTNATQIVAP